MKLAKSIVLKVTYSVQAIRAILQHQNVQMLHICFRRGPGFSPDMSSLISQVPERGSAEDLAPPGSLGCTALLRRELKQPKIIS